MMKIVIFQGNAIIIIKTGRRFKRDKPLSHMKYPPIVSMDALPNIPAYRLGAISGEILSGFFCDSTFLKLTSHP